MQTYSFMTIFDRKVTKKQFILHDDNILNTLTIFLDVTKFVTYSHSFSSRGLHIVNQEQYYSIGPGKEGYASIRIHSHRYT